MKRINFRTPKYIIPAIIYIPILFLGWNILGILNTKISDEDTNISIEGAINTDMPSPDMENPNLEIKSKYQSMLNDFGKIKDHAAIQGIEVETKSEYDEKENSLYSEDEIARLDSLEEEKKRGLIELKKMQEETTNLIIQNNNDNPKLEEKRKEDEITEDDEFSKQIMALQKIMSGEVSEDKIPENKNNEDKNITNTTTQDTKKTQENTKVYKVGKTNITNFNTIYSQKNENENFIKAILDETIKAENGSRLRIRLLENIEVDNTIIPKGSYLYAIVTGFSAQRIQATVSSILLKDKHIPVSLSIYDTDGLEGFYVPSSTFRELKKEIGSQALSQNVNFNQNSQAQNLETVAFQTLQGIYQSTASAVSSNIKKNKAKLKYNTAVFLINNNK